MIATKNLDQFFLQDVPRLLRELPEDRSAKWGEMSAPEMLDHLRRGVELSLSVLDSPIITPEEHLPKVKRFLMSEKAFPPLQPAPAAYAKLDSRVGERNFDELKVDLLKALVEMLTYFEKNPDHEAVHEVFGRLNVPEWQYLHYKHIKHHFTQFGLMEQAP